MPHHFPTQEMLRFPVLYAHVKQGLLLVECRPLLLSGLTEDMGSGLSVCVVGEAS